MKKAEKSIVILALSFTTLMFALSFFIARPVAGLFTSDAEIISLAEWGIRVYMIGVIPLALQYAFVDGMTGLGQPKFAFLLSMTRKLAFFLVSLLVLPRFFGPQGAFYAEPIADIAGSLLSTIVFSVLFPKILKKRENSSSAAV